MTHKEDIFFYLKKHWGYDSFRPLQQEIIEAVLDNTCGKNYQKTKFIKQSDAQTAAEADYPKIKDCQGIDHLPTGTSVMIYFPTDANPDKNYANIHEYWKALFSNFGVSTVKSNL